MRDAWVPMRTAGAVARELLLAAASKKSGVPVGELVAVDGEIRRRDGAAVARFGELVDFVGDLGADGAAAAEAGAQFKLIGKPQPRLDIPAKVDGAATFGIDVRQPGQLYAAVRHAPTFGGEVAGFAVKGGQAQRHRGGRDRAGRHRRDRHELVAGRALLDEGLEIKWRDGPRAAARQRRRCGSATRACSRTAGRADPHVRHRAAPRGAASSRRSIARPTGAHAPMEPMNCTALFAAGKSSSSGCPTSRRP